MDQDGMEWNGMGWDGMDASAAFSFVRLFVTVRFITYAWDVHVFTALFRFLIWGFPSEVM